MIAYASQPENAIRLIAKGQKLSEKQEQQQLKARIEALRPLSWWLAQAQKWFNLYIRLRDKGKPCISCGRKTGAKMNAGHYLSVGDYPHLRFCELNVHLQCEHCNRYKGGNTENYRKALILKIGESAVAWLECEHPAIAYQVEDLKALIDVYKFKSKALKKC